MPTESALTAERRVVLVGNPNVGKTALFNALTGLRQRVANFPGVTVDVHVGTAVSSRGRFQVQDLPGVASLIPRAPDERITADVLLGKVTGDGPPDVVVVVIDALQMTRGLFVLSQVLECGLPTVLCVNMADEARKAEALPSASTLSDALSGLPVVLTSATKREGIDVLLEAIATVQAPAMRPPELPGLLGLPSPSIERWARIREVADGSALSESEARARWAFAHVIAKASTNRLVGTRTRSDALDRFFLHPLVGPLFFAGTILLLFQAVFGLAEAPMEWIDAGIGFLADSARAALPRCLWADFLADGVIAGVGSVVIFLPQILLLFLFLGLLEDSGYMTRAAFLIDRPLRAVGLSGRAFIPMLSSFACAVPGIMATRSIESRRERWAAIFSAPFLTCSARLPVYTILIGGFLPTTTLGFGIRLQALVLFGLYVLGILLAVLAALLVNRLQRHHAEAPQFLELAPYRRPEASLLLRRLFDRAYAFLRRAGTVILLASILIWVASNFPRTSPTEGASEAEARAEILRESAAGRLGRWIEPIFEPMGFDWRLAIGVLGSLAAREVFVSTMSVVYAVESTESDEAASEASLTLAMKSVRNDRTGELVFSLPVVIALLVFYAAALQCVSTIAIVARETRSPVFAAVQFGVYTVVAYGLAVVAYQGLRAIGL